ncbi:MAG: hypothetical protein MUC96_32095 [Myxococcaceae bacterium]|nr:hypothetical protein [Myxococcaceae bacterium]
MSGLEVGSTLGDGWRVEALSPDGSVRFVRPPSVDRKKALGRFIVMGGCVAVSAALVGVSAQSADQLWVLTSSLIVLFGATGLVALLAGLADLRRAALGVHLEIDQRATRVRGVLEGRGLLGQFRVLTHAGPLGDVSLRLSPFEDSTAGAGMLVVTLRDGRRLMAPDLPRVEALRTWVDSLSTGPRRA